MKKKHYKIVLSAKPKSMLNRIESLISRASFNSDISHDEFVLVNNVLKENDMKEAIRNLKTSTVH